MEDNDIISWIFLAIAMGSEQNPVSLRDISTIADGINHAVPLERELQLSIRVLTKKGLIEKSENRYRLTEAGRIRYNFASSREENVFSIWKDISASFRDGML